MPIPPVFISLSKINPDLLTIAGNTKQLIYEAVQRPHYRV